MYHNLPQHHCLVPFSHAKIGTSVTAIFRPKDKYASRLADSVEKMICEKLKDEAAILAKVWMRATVVGGGIFAVGNAWVGSWYIGVSKNRLVLSDEQMSKDWPFSY